MTRARACCAAAVGLAVSACDAGFETRSIVVDLRVLAVQMNPPEVVADFDPMNPQDLVVPEVSLTALVADPGADRRLAYAIVACPPTLSLRCDDPGALVVPVSEGTSDDPEQLGAAPITGTFTATLALLQESLRLDDLAGFGGIGVQISLEVWPESATRGPDSVFAAKKMLYAPRIPPERVANQNPTFDALEAKIDDVPSVFAPGRCIDPATTPLTVAPETRVSLDPVEPDDIREDYVLPTYDGGVLMLTENMRYAWFATAGSFSDEQSGGPTDPFGNVPLLRTFLTAPSAEDAAALPDGRITLWVVQRDERGGTHFAEWCLQVVP